ncbi:unnamed protein product [Caenorhabditis nigoni]
MKIRASACFLLLFLLEKEAEHHVMLCFLGPLKAMKKHNPKMKKKEDVDGLERVKMTFLSALLAVLRHV